MKSILSMVTPVPLTVMKFCPAQFPVLVSYVLVIVTLPFPLIVRSFAMIGNTKPLFTPFIFASKSTHASPIS